ncbi:hypothetical protein ABW20_dc0109644 [Dactylellina cionopaga]|nr:hypothetical protein ABW20_dc0109644 [Dactylellina cionopaga]
MEKASQMDLHSSSEVDVLSFHPRALRVINPSSLSIELSGLHEALQDRNLLSSVPHWRHPPLVSGGPPVPAKIPISPPHRGFATVSDYRFEPYYELPKSYQRDFLVKKDLGAGAFGETALVEVVSANDGSISHGFGFTEGAVFVAKRMATDPRKEKTLYKHEWKVLNELRGHRNIINAICTQQPGKGDHYGHIFMEHCDLGDVYLLQIKYEADLKLIARDKGWVFQVIP